MKLFNVVVVVLLFVAYAWSLYSLHSENYQYSTVIDTVSISYLSGPVVAMDQNKVCIYTWTSPNTVESSVLVVHTFSFTTNAPSLLIVVRWFTSIVQVVTLMLQILQRGLQLLTKCLLVP